MIRPISISLSPNTEPDDVWAALLLSIQPWRWQKGGQTPLLEEEFQKYLGVKYAFAFNSGRSAFLAILESLGLQKGDEVLLQAFTCNAVPNPILWSGLKPVYVDCNEDYNMSPADLEKKIILQLRLGQAPKAVLVQHTFGLPADIEKIQEICTKHNLILLEDCAHALGATYKGKKVGTFGKVSFFSFSRDKVISSVYGGMAVTNDGKLAEKLRLYQRDVRYPSLLWINQQVVHPWLMNLFILPTYRIFGRYLLRTFQWFHILSKAVHWKEKQGKKPGYFPKALPNALATLARKQLRKLDRFNSHRKEIAAMYTEALSHSQYQIPDTAHQEGNIFLRFPLRHEKAHEIIKKAWRQNLLIGDWYTTPIAPHDTQIEKMGYEWGSCPVAERLAQTTFNLPTHIRIGEKEVNKIIHFLKSVAT